MAGMLETTQSEAAGVILADAAADPLAKARDLAIAANLPPKMVEALLRRARRQYLAPMQELRKVTQGALAAQVDDRLAMILEQVDDLSVLEAPLRDKAYAFDRLFNTRQLMRGEPTAILSTEDRRKLNELGAALVVEMKRRGMTIDATPINEYSGSHGPTSA